MSSLETRSDLAPPREVNHVEGSPTTRIDVGRFLQIALQLGLVLSVALWFGIELERGFGVVAVIIFLGFLLHAWLPPRIRIPFFVLLTLIAVGVLLRADGVWLIAIGLALLAICHLPVPWAARVVLVFVAAAGLAVLQIGWIEVPWATAVIPILAAMFMFRLILYMYDLKTEKSPAGFWQRIAYFFMLPNLCFPLFPVVDYKTFLRTYYDAPAADIYQKGVFWMLRGVSHLLLYRVVYHLLPIADSDLSGIVGVYAFMAMTYGLYLRVSGLFHLTVGSLCLFGFNLPLTNNHYFLASSFNDLWRRINIYWKDFMMTTVFYPIFMWSRDRRMNTRLVLATGGVFFVTWFLHSYQWFWLQGAFPVRSIDITFWGFLGVALAINTVWEARRGRRRVVPNSAWSWGRSFSVTAQTIAVFTVMAILWSLWNSESYAEWGYRLLRIRESDPADWMIFGLLIFGAMIIGVGGQWLQARDRGLGYWERLAWRKAEAVVPVAAVIIFLVSLPSIHSRMGTQLPRVVAKVKTTGLNRLDAQRQERGYYEVLTRSTQLAFTVEGDVGEDDVQNWVNLRETGAVRPTRDIRGFELVPGVEVIHKGVIIRTNDLGLRDREYDRIKGPGTFRMAIVGSSHVMGTGVPEDHTFENLLEDRLNLETSAANTPRYEILNFGVAGYGLLQTVGVVDSIVLNLQPDMVLYVVHPGEIGRAVERLRPMLEQGAEPGEEYDFVAEVIRRARVHHGLPVSEFSRRLKPFGRDLVDWAYRHMAASIKSRGAKPVFVFLPMVDRDFDRSELELLIRQVRESDSEVIVLSNVYENHDPEGLWVAKDDHHPNTRGHELVAARLYEELLDKRIVQGAAEETETVDGFGRSL